MLIGNNVKGKFTFGTGLCIPSQSINYYTKINKYKPNTNSFFFFFFNSNLISKTNLVIVQKNLLYVEYYPSFSSLQPSTHQPSLDAHKL